MRSVTATWLAFWLMACLHPIHTSAETLEARCAEPLRGCKVLICDKNLIRTVRQAYKKGDLVELLRHTWKDDDHPDDESTPLTPVGIEQATTIHEGLVKAGLTPSRVEVSSYLRTRETANLAIPRKEEQSWSEPAMLRKDQCFREIPESLRAESKDPVNTVYVTHSSCLFSALYVDRVRNFDPTGDEHYGVMIFLNRKSPQQPIACMWPSDWKLWPAR